jgi:hypothetical protein
MARPGFERYGDAFFVTWPERGFGFAIDRIRDSYDGLKAELTVDGIAPEAKGLIFGPVNLGLQSSESQQRMSVTLATRVNGMKPDQWLGMLAQACAMVSQAWRTPSPTIDLSTFEDSGEISYLLHGLIPKGETTLLYGDGESAKSLIALLIAASCELGLNVPWGPKLDVGRVLYCDWETNPAMVAKRLRRIALGLNVTTPSLSYRQCQRSMTDELPSIREDIARKKITLVVIDSIGFATKGSLTEDETAREAMNALRQMEPATRLVVAHVNASTAADPKKAARPFGSTFFWNGMRSGIEVRKAPDQQSPDELDVGLYHRKANDGTHHKPIALRVAFDGLAGPIAIDTTDMQDSPDLAVGMPLNQRIRLALKTGSKTTKDLAEQFDEKEDTVRTTLNRMKDAVRLEAGGGQGKLSRWGLSSHL